MLSVSTNVAITAELIYSFDRPADVLLAIEAIPMDDQRLLHDLMIVKGSGPLQTIDGMEGLGRRTWLHAEGDVTIRYDAGVAIDRAPTAIAGLSVGPRTAIPAAYLTYLMPSRYCPSDRFENFVASRFAMTDPGQRVLDLTQWVHDNLTYIMGSSTGATTATDTFLSRQGVCRDYAHLLISLCRASDIPARMVSAYALDLALPDFHAVVEVFLDGRWYLVDATRLAREEHLVRIAVGRDATDIGFMTIFGSATMVSQTVSVTRS